MSVAFYWDINWPINYQKLNISINMSDLVSNIIIGIIVGGRLGYVLFYDPTFYMSNPSQIIAIWNGGMAFHGGAIGAFAATIIASVKKIKPPFIKALIYWPFVQPQAYSLAGLQILSTVNYTVAKQHCPGEWYFQQAET